MKLTTKLLAASALLSCVGFAAPASAAILLDQVNVAAQTNTATTLNFTAGSPTTTLSFAGFNVPSFITLTNIGLFASGSGTNLLTNAFSFTAAPSGSLASQFSDGTSVGALSFGGVSTGSYDIFSQSVGTTSGANYTLSFNLSSNGSPNGLRISASDALDGAVPEPATWAMMLIGFGAVGFAMRRQKVTAKISYAA
ncbi:MAG: PEPxxWA-CTERM sorting domain-containing protein [Sphingomicrobium sp.]|nr:PEPxxWA-CTERM sorting domain-containing protein [Sphingomonadales bacterium]